MRRTADLVDSAGGPPASVGMSLIWRPRMPPALLISSVASSALAFCVGPNSDAGPLSAMNPILNSSAAAAGRMSPGRAERYAARGGTENRSPRQSLLPNAHVDVSLVFLSYYQEA
jgi:hypothetical protein